MNKAQFNKFIRDTFDRDILDTNKSGQSEYALSEDAFDNFNRLAAEMGIDRKQVLMIFFSKHRDGVISYLKGHKSQREPVQGRIKDMIVYLFLLWGMIEEETKAPIPEPFHAFSPVQQKSKLVARDLGGSDGDGH
jgi:hypothetical protein